MNQVYFQLCSTRSSQEVDGFRLWLLSISLLWRRGIGVLDTGPEQASLPCFPFCQLVNEFGRLQVELGPLSLPLFLAPFQSSVVLHCHPFCSLGHCGAVQSWTATLSTWVESAYLALEPMVLLSLVP